ncbi:protein YmgL [Escherichia coli]
MEIKVQRLSLWMIR